MKRFCALVILILICGLILPAQQQSDQQDQPEQEDQQQPQREQQQKQQKRPTLGPAPAPTTGAGGPKTDLVINRRKLLRVRKVYVERIDNNLGTILAEGLAKSGRFQVVADKKKADAVLRGTCFDARHLRTVHSEVYLSDRVTGKAIWQDNVRLPYNPPPLRKTIAKTADEILRHLARTVRTAQMH